MNMNYVIGIDVGTGSVRGALVNKVGKIIKTYSESINTWNPRPNFYQQSSINIWSACCKVIKLLIEDISPENVKGIGFDATCSLAVFDANGEPVSVTENDEDEQNVMLWMDHRAKDEAEIINKTKHPILKYVGGAVSLEMMVPKILWLKNNNSRCWERVAHFFLLPDFLTWKATKSLHRSLCSVVCKCNYDADLGWDKEFFDEINLGELSDNKWEKIGSTVINPGELCGKLTEEAAKELGLVAGIPVAASLIDAHAGGLSLMGCFAENVSTEFTTRLALISGTSTCHMAQTTEEIFVPGVWGPYYNVMMPNMWLLEGGQSLSGALIDHIIDIHPATNSIKRKHAENFRITEYLNNLLNKMAKERNVNSVDELTKDTHVWPDFHGNRSPLADPTLRGMVRWFLFQYLLVSNRFSMPCFKFCTIIGLTLEKTEEELAILYLATIQALAYGTKHIIESMKDAGHKSIQTILICGGLSKNELFVRTHANALGVHVLVPQEEEPVLVGAAELAAFVSGIYSSLQEAVLNMSGPAKQIKPNSDIMSYHSKKFKIFLEMVTHQYCCRKIMESDVQM